MRPHRTAGGRSRRMRGWVDGSCSKRWYDGQGGIRTHDTVAGIPVFETGSFSHSDTCPDSAQLLGGKKFTSAHRGLPAAAAVPGGSRLLGHLIHHGNTEGTETARRTARGAQHTHIVLPSP